MKRKPVEETVADSATFAAWLDAYRSEPGADVSGSAEFYELCAEVRIGCTYGMHLCLGREQPIAYLLGDVDSARAGMGATPGRIAEPCWIDENRSDPTRQEIARRATGGQPFALVVGHRSLRMRRGEADVGIGEEFLPVDDPGHLLRIWIPVGRQP